MKKKLIYIFFLCVIFMDDAYSQCSMCKKVATDASAESGDTSIGEQLNFGILYLLIIPYIILFLLFRKKIKGFWKEFKSAGR